MNIHRSTSEYEHWVQSYISLNVAELNIKHDQMALSQFAFLRATFYHWMRLWLSLAGAAADAPEVLCVGDIHIENFGTWRDAEGRLAWGVNDFDEACILPYTQDLVRLTVSAWLAMRASHFKLERNAAASAILDGYLDQLSKGPEPFVIAEKHAWMAPLALSNLRDPEKFWIKLSALPSPTADALSAIPSNALALLLRALPAQEPAPSFHNRVAGLGSLGRMRIVAINTYQGGKIAREVKALLPSAAGWAMGQDSGQILSSEIISRAVRCADPHMHFLSNFIVRRLAPDCSKIEIATLPAQRDEKHLLKAMGQELANIHAGSGNSTAIEAHVEKNGRDGHWLFDCAQHMEAAMLQAFAEWCNPNQR